MHRILATSIALIAAAPALAAVDLNTADQNAIRAAALDYAEGWYSGDRERMGRSLHEQLAKRAYLPDPQGARSLHVMDKTRLLAGNTPDHAQKYADQPKRADVEILDGFGNAATVKLSMDGWVDYMHLSRTPDGQWQIINVLWELLPRK